MPELHWLSVTELARAIATRAVSPVEVVRAHLERIEAFDGKLRAFIALFADQALAAAKAAEVAVTNGEALGPLHGVPIGLKDLYDVQGVPTTGGSSFLDRPAAEDSTVARRLREAGAILLGKLNLHEFAYGPEGINRTYGTSWNPWDATSHRLPGGSSSGSGVAVAAGLCPAAMGSDTGGSIRIPAALCGIVGLKPTYGRVSRAGVLPLAWSLDHAGPMTRTVADAALLLKVLAGYDPRDPTTSVLPVADYPAALEAPVKGLRVGLLREDFLATSDREVLGLVAAALKALEGLGCAIQEVSLPHTKYVPAASYAIIAAEAMAFHEPLLKRHAAEYAPDVRQRLLTGQFLLATQYLKGQRVRRLLCRDVEEAFTRVDCLLAPTLPVAAPPLEAERVTINGEGHARRQAFLRYTRPFNLTGHPVVSVPCGFTGEGLPVGMQIVGRPFDEVTILRLAYAYEQATEWHRRRPPAP